MHTRDLTAFLIALGLSAAQLGATGSVRIPVQGWSMPAYLAYCDVVIPESFVPNEHVFSDDFSLPHAICASVKNSCPEALPVGGYGVFYCGKSKKFLMLSKEQHEDGKVSRGTCQHFAHLPGSTVRLFVRTTPPSLDASGEKAAKQKATT